MKRYEVTLNGRTPLLMHADNIEAQDELKLWQVENPEKGVKGDDRYPAWTWITRISTDFTGQYVAITQPSLVAMIRDASKQILLKSIEPGGGSQKRATECAMSNIVVQQDGILIVNGNPISYDTLQCIAQMDEADDESIEQSELNTTETKKKTRNDIKKECLTDGKSAFTMQVDAVRSIGFDLDMRPVVVNKKRHVRIRPKFPVWSCSFTLLTSGPFEKQKNLDNLLSIAAERIGVCDWRPSKGGTYGQFNYTLNALSAKAA